jgi:predicted NBD/HSP70 family sugar kinase
VTAYVLAVDFGGTKATVAAVDPGGAVLAEIRLPMLAERGAEQAVDRALDHAAGVVGGLDGPPRAVGVASPGIVLSDRILLAPNVPGWTELRLGERFSAALGVPTVCATDVKAATLAEARWGNLRGVHPGVHLNLGTGIAVGVLIDDRVLTGAHGAAGEIGYNIRFAGGRLGPHDGHAPLEEVAGGGAIGGRGRAVGGTGDAASVFRLAATDPAARAFLDETLDELAVHLANTAILVDPERITVGGGLVGSAGVILPALDRLLKLAVPFPPELMLARFAQDGPLIGAAALAWDIA